MEANHSNQKSKGLLSFRYFLAIIFISIGLIMIGKNTGYIDKEGWNTITSQYYRI